MHRVVKNQETSGVSDELYCLKKKKLFVNMRVCDIRISVPTFILGYNQVHKTCVICDLEVYYVIVVICTIPILQWYDMNF